MLLIGDVHGKIDRFWKLIQKLKPKSFVQLGDFGFHNEHRWFQNTDSLSPDRESRRILFGNHDEYPMIREWHSLGDFGEWNGLYFIRGAESIDQYRRIQNWDWFPEEQMNFLRLLDCYTDFRTTKPEIVISHCAPTQVQNQILGLESEKKPNQTTQMMQDCFEQHQPHLWVFGHYHRSFDETVDGTRFVCLNELEPFFVS